MANEKPGKATKTTSTKNKLKLEDGVALIISSNVFGELVYINHKTGDKYVWNTMGETQTLYVSDIRAMKSTQRRFLEENWILIDRIADRSDAYESVDIHDIYEALQISQYYKEFLCPSNLNDVFNWSIEDIRKKVSKMSASTKERIAIRANELIQAGILDSMSKVKVLSEVIGCELASYQED